MDVEQFIKNNLESILEVSKNDSPESKENNAKVKESSGSRLESLFTKATHMAGQAVETAENSVSVKVMLAPNIPESKLDAVIKSYAPDESPDYVVGVVDTGTINLAKGMMAGLVLFGDKLYFKETVGHASVLQFTDIKSVTYGISESEKQPELSIDLINGQREILPESIIKRLNGEMLAAFLNTIGEIIAANGGATEQTKQALPLEEMDDDVKLLYVEFLANYCLSHDKGIDADVYREIMSMIARISMGRESRFKIRAYMSENNYIQENVELLDDLQGKVPSGSFPIVQKSMMKDILVLSSVHGDLHNWQQDDFIKWYCKKINMTVEQVNVIVSSIQNDADIINKRLNDTDIKKSLNNLVGRAAGVGVPMIALYFSGTTGVSAIGMTTGLASLGGAGVAGLSSMFTGVGAVAVLGIVSYEVVKRVSGQKDLENNQQRERMLQEIIGNSQKTLNFLIEDVNYIAKLLNSALTGEKVNQIRIQKLARQLAEYSMGAQKMTRYMERSQVESLITKMPLEISINRLTELTQGATKQKAREFVLQCYPDLQLNTQLNLTQMKLLYSILDKIGYLKLMASTMASVKGKVKSLVGAEKTDVSEKNNSIIQS